MGDLEGADVAGARLAGMRSTRILRARHEEQTAADAAVARVTEVLDVLRRWGEL